MKQVIFSAILSIMILINLLIANAIEDSGLNNSRAQFLSEVANRVYDSCKDSDINIKEGINLATNEGPVSELKWPYNLYTVEGLINILDSLNWMDVNKAFNGMDGIQVLTCKNYTLDFYKRSDGLSNDIYFNNEKILSDFDNKNDTKKNIIKDNLLFIGLIIILIVSIIFNYYLLRKLKRVKMVSKAVDEENKPKNEGNVQLGEV